jgi:hypothetical protein
VTPEHVITPPEVETHHCTSKQEQIHTYRKTKPGADATPKIKK